MRVISLHVRDFKRIRVAELPVGDGVTTIVGRNGAGKSSLIDALMVALAGRRTEPARPIRDGAEAAEITVDLGELTVRKRITAGGSRLEVTASSGAPLRSPQEVLDRLVGDLTFDPLAFARARPAEQVATLARIVGFDLEAHERIRREVYDQRTHANRRLKDAETRLAGMDVPADAPAEETSAAAILAEIGEAQRVNAAADDAARTLESAKSRLADARSRVERLRAELVAAEQAEQAATDALIEAEDAHVAAARIDIGPLHDRLAGVERLNVAARARQAAEQRRAEVAALRAESESLTAELAKLDRALRDRIEQAELPVGGLGFDGQQVTFGGVPFSQASAAEQLRASVGLGLAEHRDLKLMLVRDGSLLDDRSMAMLADLAAEAEAQVLVERVDDGRQPGIVIEDGAIVERREAIGGAA